MNLWSLERSSEVQVTCDSTNQPMIPVPNEVLEKSEQLMAKQSMGLPLGELEFSAFVRIIDKIDSSYKD